MFFDIGKGQRKKLQKSFGLNLTDKKVHFLMSHRDAQYRSVAIKANYQSYFYIYIVWIFNLPEVKNPTICVKRDRDNEFI